jgi:exosome complex RNA-binding protein Csl4
MPAREIKPGVVVVTCQQCDKPLTVVNVYGMFCEDRCGETEAKAGANELEAFLVELGEPVE